jgi:hypothetical protein
MQHVLIPGLSSSRPQAKPSERKNMMPAARHSLVGKEAKRYAVPTHRLASLLFCFFCCFGLVSTSMMLFAWIYADDSLWTPGISQGARSHSTGIILHGLDPALESIDGSTNSAAIVVLGSCCCSSRTLCGRLSSSLLSSFDLTSCNKSRNVLRLLPRLTAGS